MKIFEMDTDLTWRTVETGHQEIIRHDGLWIVARNAKSAIDKGTRHLRKLKRKWVGDDKKKSKRTDVVVHVDLSSIKHVGTIDVR